MCLKIDGTIITRLQIHGTNSVILHTEVVESWILGPRDSVSILLPSSSCQRAETLREKSEPKFRPLPKPPQSFAIRCARAREVVQLRLKLQPNVKGRAGE